FIYDFLLVLNCSQRAGSASSEIDIGGSSIRRNLCLDSAPEFFVPVLLEPVVRKILEYDQMIDEGSGGWSPILRKISLVLRQGRIGRHAHTEGHADVFGEQVTRAIVRQPV